MAHFLSTYYLPILNIYLYLLHTYTYYLPIPINIVRVSAATGKQQDQRNFYDFVLQISDRFRCILRRKSLLLASPSLKTLVRSHDLSLVQPCQAMPNFR